MNNWVKKSINLAHSRGYLDKLSDIYRVDLVLPRELKKEDKERIKKAVRKGDHKILILDLLDLDRFPIDDPYIGFFRRHKEALNKNPKTVKRIGEKLMDIGVPGILEGVSRSKSSSRQFGQMFKNYLHNIGMPVLSEDKFLSNKGPAILSGGDKALKVFAKRNLDYRGDKGLDLVIKKGNKFVIGEAKFITAGGGTQDKSFREAISFVKKKDNKAVRIAVLDGVLWLSGKNKENLYGNIKKLKDNQTVLSALLLKEFIDSL